MKILCTGGAGFIGSALTKRLVADGHEVTVLDDLSRGQASRLDGFPVTLIPGDVRNELLVHSAVQGQDTIIHLAYLQGTQTFYEEPRKVLDVALRGMLNLLNACEQWGVGDLMLVSSSEAYQVASEVPTPETVALTVPDPLNPRYSYGGGKIACEIMASAWQRAGVLDRVIIVRPHNIIGPDMGREHVVPQFCLRMNDLVTEHPGSLDQVPFRIQGTGHETRSFCHVSDCVEGLALLLEGGAPLGVYHLGTEDERTIAQVAVAVAACYDRTIKLIPGSLPKGSPPRRCPDISKMAALGYRPQVGFAEAISDTAAWYRSHG